MVGFIFFCSFGCPYRRCSQPLDSIDVCFDPPCPHSHQPLLASDNLDWLSRRQNYKKSSISPSFFLKTLEKVVCLELNCYLCSEIAGRQGAIARLTITVPAAHTIRTAGGSFYELWLTKRQVIGLAACYQRDARTIQEQIELLENRGMLFRDKAFATECLKRISYFRLKAYWWDMQCDPVNHVFTNGSCFEDVIERY